MGLAFSWAISEESEGLPEIQGRRVVADERMELEPGEYNVIAKEP